MLRRALLLSVVIVYVAIVCVGGADDLNRVMVESGSAAMGTTPALNDDIMQTLDRIRRNGYNSGYSSSYPSPPSNSCEDVPEWNTPPGTAPPGAGCETFNQQIEQGMPPSFLDVSSSFGLSANQACCVFGGGSSAGFYGPPPTASGSGSSSWSGLESGSGSGSGYPSPTPMLTATPTPPYACATVDVITTTHSFASEISWTLGSSCSQPQGTFSDNQQYTHTCCLPPNVTITGVCTDSYGDGWHGGYLTILGQEYCRTFTYGHSMGFSVAIGPTPAPTPAPTSTPTAPTPSVYPTGPAGSITIMQVVSIDFGASDSVALLHNFAGSASQTMANFGESAHDLSQATRGLVYEQSLGAHTAPCGDTLRRQWS